MKETVLVLAVVVGALPIGRTMAQTPPPSRSDSALTQAAAGKNHVLILFWRQPGEQTDATWRALQGAAAGLTPAPLLESILVDDPAEKAFVERHGLDRAPMPIVVAFAPNGAITRAFPNGFDHEELRTAFVSPGMAACLKAAQHRKLVLVRVISGRATSDAAAFQGVADFASDPRYAPVTEVVTLAATDSGEAGLLGQLQIDPATAPVTVFLAPPGSIIGTFPGPVTKEQLVAKLASAQASACPGGQCGPGGCCPSR